MANNAKSIWLVEVKHYYCTTDGYDIQAADLGMMPNLFRNYDDAQVCMAREIEKQENIFGYKKAKEYTADELGTGTCVSRTALVDASTHDRVIVSMYYVFLR